MPYLQHRDSRYPLAASETLIRRNVEVEIGDPERGVADDVVIVYQSVPVTRAKRGDTRSTMHLVSTTDTYSNSRSRSLQRGPGLGAGFPPGGRSRVRGGLR